MDVMLPTACFGVNQITVYSYGILLYCTTVGQAHDSITQSKSLIGWLVPKFACLCFGPPWLNLRFSSSLTFCES